MAILRTAAPAAAVLVALMAIVPATSQVQAAAAPLQLVPGPNQAKPQAKPATRDAIKGKNAAKPVAKAPGKATAHPNTARSHARPATVNSPTRHRQSEIATNSQRGRSTPSARVNRTAAVPYLTASRPVLRRGTQEPPIIARGPNSETHQDRVMRGRDSVSLVAMLPWWRNDRMQPVNYGSTEAESKVLEAAAVWLAANGGASETETPAGEPTYASPDETIEVADADELNEIDRTAEATPAVPTPTFLQSLLALIGGAAAAAVATARLLFA